MRNDGKGRWYLRAGAEAVYAKVLSPESPEFVDLVANDYIGRTRNGVTADDTATAYEFYLDDRVHELLYGGDASQNAGLIMAERAGDHQAEYTSPDNDIRVESPETISERLATGAILLLKTNVTLDDLEAIPNKCVDRYGDESLVLALPDGVSADRIQAAFLPASYYDEVAPMISDKTRSKLVRVEGTESLYDASSGSYLLEYPENREDNHHYELIRTPRWGEAIQAYIKEHTNAESTVWGVHASSGKTMNDSIAASKDPGDSTSQ